VILGVRSIDDIGAKDTAMKDDLWISMAEKVSAERTRYDPTDATQRITCSSASGAGSMHLWVFVQKKLNTLPGSPAEWADKLFLKIYETTQESIYGRSHLSLGIMELGVRDRAVMDK